VRPVGSRYLLEEPLGRGATGTVWRARVRDDAGGPGSELVAIKVLKEELATDPDIVMRFLRERSVLLRLVHPNIVRVRDLVVEGELLALVMDLVDGPDLHRYLQSHGPLSPVAGALLMAQIADALATSHADGIVHRDLKPANVLLATRQDGGGAEQMHPLLTDFGIARLADSPGITRTHEFVGTPAYIAPESAEGREQTSAVDVYGAGIMLYELVTGQPPFQGDGPLQILQAHLTQEPQRPRTLPEPLWTVIERCLRKAPAQRPDAARVAAALRTVAAGIGVHASPAAIEAAYAVGELLAPAPGAEDPTLPEGVRYDPAAPTVFGASAVVADATRVLPPATVVATQAAEPMTQPLTQPMTQPVTQPLTQAQPQAAAEPDPHHPWESQLRAARTRNEQTRIGYPVPVEQQPAPQVAPPPYRAAPQEYRQPYQQPYQPEPYQQPYRPEPYQQPYQQPYAPEPYESEEYEPAPQRQAPRRKGPSAIPREVPREAPREPEPEPRREREPRPPRRRRMRIPGAGCLRILVFLAVIAAVVWYFTPVQHWIHDVEGAWHQVVHWWDSITGTANKIKNEVPQVPTLPSGLPTSGN
jgi:serine/threonine-protein kinase